MKLKLPHRYANIYRAKHGRSHTPYIRILTWFSGERKGFFMTELDLYLQCIPMIAEMIVICQKLSVQQYEEWKRETLEAAPESVKRFLVKVFVVISAKLDREAV